MSIPIILTPLEIGINMIRRPVGPHDDGAACPLTGEVEEQIQVVHHSGIRGSSAKMATETQRVNLDSARRAINRVEQRLALTASGALGFVALAYLRTTDDVLFFLPTEFLY